MKHETYETPIEEYVVKKVKKELGIVSIKLQLSKDTGYPDRMYLIPGGVPLFHEYKKSEGGVLSEKQIKIQEMLSKLGYVVEVYNDKIEAFKSIVYALEIAKESLSRLPF